jgi:quercetin dioxygenase-like cupin family protein
MSLPEKDTTIQVLISSQEGPNFALRKFSMQKGGGMPRHTNTVEHEQYVLRGEATITIGEETHHVKTGDVVFIPEGAIHSYENTGENRSNSCASSPTRKTGSRSWKNLVNCFQRLATLSTEYWPLTTAVWPVSPACADIWAAWPRPCPPGSDNGHLLRPAN